MDSSTFEFEAFPPMGWPKWLWVFSGSSSCWVKIDGKVHKIPWLTPTALPRPQSSEPIKIFHNAGTLPARAVHADLGDASRLAFRARFLPFQRGRVTLQHDP